MSEKPFARRRRLRRLFSIWIVALLLLVAFAAFYFQIRSPQDVIAYVGMSMECPPAWKDLALRRLRKGDSVEKLEALHPPTERDDIGPFTVYSFDPPGRGLRFTGLVVVARDGKLIAAAAHSCTWGHRFFGDEAAEEEFQRMATARYGTLDDEERD